MLIVNKISKEIPQVIVIFSLGKIIVSALPSKDQNTVFISEMITYKEA